MQPTPGTYGFRWARGLAIALGFASVWMLVGVAGMAWGVLADPAMWWLLFIGALPLLLAAAFVAAFARRLPTAFVAMQPDGVRVLYPLSMDTTIPFHEIESAGIVKHHLIYGLGIRTNLAGHVALATASGPAAELRLHTPIRAQILPVIWWTHARQLRLTVERPEEFVAELTARLAASKRGARE